MPRGAATVKVLTTAQKFNWLEKWLGKMTPECGAIAREVLVDGLLRVLPVKRHGPAQPRMGAFVEPVLVAAGDVPNDWERVDVWLPSELGQQVRTTEERAAGASDSGAGGGDAAAPAASLAVSRLMPRASPRVWCRRRCR
jgi:hypothetical protein